MDPAEVLFTVGLTVAGSIAIAYTTQWLQTRERTLRLRRSLRHEIAANLSLAKSNLEVISTLGHDREDVIKGEWTYFDISPLRAVAYHDFRLGGQSANLTEEIRATLDEIYDLIDGHNRQVLFLTMEPIPRTRGMSARLGRIVEKLGFLERELPRGKS